MVVYLVYHQNGAFMKFPSSPPSSVYMYVTGKPCFCRILISYEMVGNGGLLYLVGKAKENLVVIQMTERREVNPRMDCLFQKE